MDRMKEFSFIHCADLHLGCQQFNEDERWEDFGRAFGQIVEYALQKQVDYLLIAGDLFHHRSINAPTLSQAVYQLGRLKNAGIKVIAIEGNHDKAYYLEKDSWMSFLHKQGYFNLLKPTLSLKGLELKPYDGEEGAILKDPGVRFIGLGYLGATTKQRLMELDNLLEPAEDFTVVLLHAAVDKLLGQDLAGVKSEVFEKFKGKVDYFALGHLHSRQELGNFCFNPGAPECVHIDEEREGAEKGFYHVVVRNGEKEVKFIPSRRRPVYRFSLDLSGVEEASKVPGKALDFLQAKNLEGEKIILQLNLTGTVPFSSYAIDTKGLEEELKEKFSCLAVEVLNNTNLPELSLDKENMAFDRNSIEKYVLQDMIQVNRPEFKDFTEELVELILRVKRKVLAGTEEAEIVAELEKLAEKLPDVENGQEAGEANEA